MLATLPDLMIGVVIILVLSASMSTLSSLVLTSGSTLTLDIIDPAMAKARKGTHMNERNKLLCIRLLVLFFIIVSSVIAIIQAKSSVTFIAQLMGISWGAHLSCTASTGSARQPLRSGLPSSWAWV